MLPDLAAALRLQELDSRAEELRKEIAALPKHIQKIEQTLESHQRKLDADRAALAANQKDRRKHEGDIQVHEQKISKLRDQMLQAKTNEQYRAFQHEIEYCQKQIRDLEDRILDLMTESEPLEAGVKKAEAALAEERKRVEAEKQDAKSRTAQDQKDLERISATREEVAASMTKAFYANYERLRKARGGIAVSEVVEGMCSVCHIALRPGVLQELRQGSVHFCDSCKRILIHQPPQSFEDLAGENAAAAR
ncbi:MAG: hypothetical protein IPM24_14160 [Bryobacterales bacterium]|jgi:uncharacterized protein|nr:hypothetical protein [Bryobacterales bacterium]